MWHLAKRIAKNWHENLSLYGRVLDQEWHNPKYRRIKWRITFYSIYLSLTAKLYGYHDGANPLFYKDLFKE